MESITAGRNHFRGGSKLPRGALASVCDFLPLNLEAASSCQFALTCVMSRAGWLSRLIIRRVAPKVATCPGCRSLILDAQQNVSSNLHGLGSGRCFDDLRLHRPSSKRSLSPRSRRRDSNHEKALRRRRPASSDSSGGLKMASAKHDKPHGDESGRVVGHGRAEEGGALAE